MIDPMQFNHNNCVYSINKTHEIHMKSLEIAKRTQSKSICKQAFHASNIEDTFFKKRLECSFQTEYTLFWLNFDGVINR